MKYVKLGLALLALAVVVAGCGEDQSKTSDYKKVGTASKGRHVFIPKNGVEFNNYNNAQKLYDNPSTIIWCSTTWGNPSSPIMTVPVAGKLTSSTVSYFPTRKEAFNSNDSPEFYTPELKSVDGMYHGTPPPYRYGFTPGGQYIDFFNMPTVCTTALTKFQRQKTAVVTQVDQQALSAQKKAEQQLATGNRSGAQKELSGLGG